MTPLSFVSELSIFYAVFKLVENVAKNLPKNYQKSEEKCELLPLHHGLPQSSTYTIFWVNFFKTFPTNSNST
jgi:hypothetical protein